MDEATLTPGVFPSICNRTYANHTTQAFWDAAKRERLSTYKCSSCGTCRIPPTPVCFVCQSSEGEWIELPGTGTLYSFTVIRHPLAPELAGCVPYVSGIIELDGTQGAGARMMANVVECDVDAVRIGDRVEVVWEHVNDEMTVHRFRPVATARSRA